MKNNYDTRLKLAKDVVEDLSLEALYEMAVAALASEYEDNDEFFQDSWLMQYDMEDEDGET